MDQRLKYEQLIASKLESIPVPDMEDAIWARIKAQLDIDLPSDEDGDHSPSSPSGPGIIGWGLSIILIALITIFFLNKNKPEPTFINNQSTTTEQTNQPAEQTTGPPGVNNVQLKPSTLVTTSVDSSSTAGTQDSVAQQDLSSVLPITRDSIQPSQTDPVVTQAPVTKDTVPAVQKKGKGVTGIKDGDYRIVPKKGE